ncbi:carboxypeptidase-like regulatory domain-containing protein [Lutibacter sp. A64]|uniref:carboxypeptidase-like regulatory domain-containing protein n=1 Tax=Lutibacter sp. A64 TaxID=2918526 RepID=UPI001F05CF40|nr:carboxypeptidase-like regulatory domain-containing protein [Lutibacter sp. A64]UMB54539.1 carboxypeptidase-like regulatory domain-containing protein [Lutibacter sp. A64]
MIKKILYTALFFVTLNNFSQELIENDTIKKTLSSSVLKGQVVNQLDKTPLKGAHIFNLNSVIGTITNDDGNFELPITVSDTIYVSYLGHQSIKLKITNDLLKGNELVIELYEKAEEIGEVVVKSHKLIGVLEIDAKNVPKDKYARIHINGLAQTYEVGGTRQRKDFNSPVDALFKPIDFVYNMFGKKPKQLKKLKKMRDNDELREQLEAKFNRELMMEYLEMDSTELTELLNECNYSDYFIKQASDLQLIEAVLLCYENYKAIKKGSTIKTTDDK